jgi:uncharacterized protein (TIGR02145 family)
MTDENGSFEISSIELASPYALLKADGYYRNEVTGRLSAAPITLYAVADITGRGSANVNILTHLEYHRVQSLAAQGKSLGEAKEQALGEILAVFGISGSAKGSEDMSIFGTDDGDAALLAISVLLQGGLGENDFSALLGSLSQGFKSKGAWEDEARKAEVADWASEADLANIRNNIEGWGLAQSVPDFEKYVYNYWVASYKLGVCNATKNGTELQNGNDLSSHRNYYYKCNGSKWVFSQDNSCAEENKCDGKCYDKAAQFCSAQDKKIYGKCDNSVYNTDTHFCLSGVRTLKCGGYAYQPWEFCLNSLTKGKCGNAPDGAEVRDTVAEHCCGTGKYAKATQFCHTDNTVHDKCGGTTIYDPATQLCVDNAVRNKCGSSYYNSDTHGCCKNSIYPLTREHYGKSKPQFCDARDGKTYVHVTIGSSSSAQIWMAENLNYNASGSKCYAEGVAGVSQDSIDKNCETYGRLYNWATAMNIDPKYNTTLYVATTNHQGICPERWHIPSGAEWNTLMKYANPNCSDNSSCADAGTKLKAASGWVALSTIPAGTDDYGFAALPGAHLDNNTFGSVGIQGGWWSATESNDGTNGSHRWDMNRNYEEAKWYSNKKSILFSIRCVKD